MTSGRSWASSDAARRVMQGNRSRDTKPELAVRSLLHRMGLRYRVDRRPVASLPRRADIVFGSVRVAVFIDGCYWHACPLHYAPSKTNVTYWAEKARRNAARDVDTTRRLTDEGWTVLRFWEHEDPSDVASRIRDAVSAAR
ncbi:very short patch repair endonuclease [Curtobacterium oceanosedimentum]|uniref:very short patch repair endonuclease n=1 Tax=Curtobacterium oceanosedimentum TaxID=465820 RepID=UPI0009E8523A|nr:very short patch repair endonuclease [Curtobacterium oceanosedimentum]